MALFGYKKRGNFLEVVTGQLTRLHWALELSTNSAQRRPFIALGSFLKASTSTFTFKTFENGK